MTSSATSLPPVQIRLDQLSLSDERMRGGGHSNAVVPCQYGGQTYLYKEYQDVALQQLHAPSLETMIQRGRLMPLPQRRQLVQRCAWPVASVWHNGTTRGMLMHRAPSEMFLYLQRGAMTIRRPRHLDVLGLSPANVMGDHEHYWEPPEKLAALGRLLDTVLWLHHLGYVVGDLQLRNALVNRQGRVFLIDCDSFVPDGGRAALPQLDPEQWKTSISATGEFTRETDFFKFALAVIRCVQENLEVWEPDRARMQTVMPGAAVRLIVDTCAGIRPENSTRRWRSLADAWPAMVSGQRMYVQLDGYVRKVWVPIVESRRGPVEETATTAAGSRNTGASPSERPSPRRRSGRTGRTVPSTTSEPGPWTRSDTVAALVGGTILLGLGGFAIYLLVLGVSWVMGLIGSLFS